MDNLETRTGPGLRLPPPIFFLAAFLIGIVLNTQWAISLSMLPDSWRQGPGWILILLGVLIMPSVLRRFRRSGTTFDVRKAASTLIADGPYQFSRNPTYVSLTLLYVGAGLLFNNGWILLLLTPVILIMDLWVIRKEERHLEVQFGEDYLRYKATVRRWL